MLTFQDLVTSSAASVHARIDFDASNDDTDEPKLAPAAAAPAALVKRASITITGNRPHDSDDDSHNHDDHHDNDDSNSISNVSRSSSFSEETDYLTKLTRDIVEGRRVSPTGDPADMRAVPSYDEFVR